MIAIKCKQYYYFPHTVYLRLLFPTKSMEWLHYFMGTYLHKPECRKLIPALYHVQKFEFSLFLDMCQYLIAVKKTVKLRIIRNKLF